MDSYVLACDVGARGAACILKNGEYLDHLIFNDSKGNFREADYNVFIRKYRKIITHAYIEDVHALFGVSAKATSGMMLNKGYLICSVSILNIRYTLVTAKNWQAVSWSGVKKITKKVKGKLKGEVVMKNKTDTKATSLIACKRLFPNVSLLATKRSKKPHDGLVDSLLIAYYGYKENNK